MSKESADEDEEADIMEASLAARLSWEELLGPVLGNPYHPVSLDRWKEAVAVVDPLAAVIMDRTWC